MFYTLVTLAEIHYWLGIIDFNEFNERIGVALWLADEHPDHVNDPRLDSDNEVSRKTDENEEYSNLKEPVKASINENNTKTNKNDENWLEFLCLGIWVFTKADPDSYPSVPHGHFKSQNTKWPKLNPFTGRVFAAKNQEENNKKLSKRQMKLIWNDEKFKSFCREMIVWYMEKFPHYEFPVRTPLRFPKW
jgi:hypothetical protein